MPPACKVLADPAMQASLKQLGVEPMPMTPAQMDDLVKRETAANLEVIKAAVSSSSRPCKLSCAPVEQSDGVSLRLSSIDTADLSSSPGYPP